jgi:hypothetical protein
MTLMTLFCDPRLAVFHGEEPGFHGSQNTVLMCPFMRWNDNVAS